MRAELPRPSVRPVPYGRSRVDAGRVELTRLAAIVHARLTRGELRPRVLAGLDRLLPPPPLPDLRVRLTSDVGLRLDGDGALARIALLCAGYEHRECEVLAGAVRPGAVFVDVGANVGWFSLMVAAHRPEAAVWAIEPLPETAGVLRRNVREAGLDSVAVHEVALGEADGAVEFVATADPAFAHARGLAASRSESGRAVRAGTEVTTCPVTTLDRLWAAAGRPQVDAVKVDVEGAEPAVLAGAREMLAQCHPLLVVEAPTEPELRAVRGVLDPLGYVLAPRPGVLPYNVIFAKEDRA